MVAGMSITSGAIAWEALEEIRRDIDDFLRDSVTAASSDGKRAKGLSRGSSSDEVTRLQREVEQLKLALSEARGDETELALVRKRPRGSSAEFVAGGEGEDEKDWTIRRLTNELEEERVLRSRDAERAKSKMEELERNNDKLLRQVKFLTNEEQAARDELKEKKDKALQEKQQLEEELRQTRRSRDKLESDVAKAKSELSRLLRLEERMAQREEDLQRSQQLVRKLEEELEKTKSTVKAKTALELEVESLKFRLGEETQRRQQLEEAEAKRPDNSELFKTLQSKVQEQERVLKRRTAEMESLRAERANTSLLQERIHELEEARDRLEQRLVSLAEVEAKHESLVAEKRHMDKQFEAVLKDTAAGGSSSSTAASRSELEGGELTANRVLKFVRNLQNEQAQVWARLGDSEARCATLTKELAEAKQRAQKEAEAGSSLEDRHFVLEEQLRVAETRIRVLERENASLKRLLDMFGSTSSNLSSSSEAGAAGAMGTGMRGAGEASVSEDRVADLEQQLEQAKMELAEAQRAVGGLASPGVLNKTRGRVSELERQVSELEGEAGMLRQKVQRLEEQLIKKRTAATEEEGASEGAAGQDVNPKTTRVLHLVNNPSTMALREEVATLRSENEGLKAQLAAGQSGEGGGVGTSIMTSGDSSSLVDKNVYGQRLREMFQERVRLFRDAVYQLTGFMATLKTEREYPQVQLRSMYAEDEDDYLLFQWTDGELQLVETNFTRKINRSLFAYLERCNSYPAFLSSLTLDLFGKQTMC